MYGKRQILAGITEGFEKFSLVDWLMFAIGVIRLLSELLQSDGNGGVKLKEDAAESQNGD